MVQHGKKRQRGNDSRLGITSERIQRKTAAELHAKGGGSTNTKPRAEGGGIAQNKKRQFLLAFLQDSNAQYFNDQRECQSRDHLREELNAYIRSHVPNGGYPEYGARKSSCNALRKSYQATGQLRAKLTFDQDGRLETSNLICNICSEHG